jgi:4-hydroxy-tetrahydrodipicolinate synthase
MPASPGIAPPEPISTRTDGKHTPRAVPHSRLTSAVCTPLNDDGSLHVEGLAAHLDDQWRHGISGVLVGGSMGLMQLLDDATYRDLVRHAAEFAHGRGEIFVGVGDTSFARTLKRIRYVEQFDVDGVVVLAPYFFTLGQADLIAYFEGLADQSKKPLYLYDLPQRTKTNLELATVLQLSKHPNIRGCKCSGEWSATRLLMDRVDGGFRVMPAQPLLVDMLARCGVRENLDGIFSLVPGLAVSIVEAAGRGDYAEAAARQGRLTEFLNRILATGRLFPACTAILNARGVPGRVHVAPMKSLDSATIEKLLADPIVQEAMRSGSSAQPVSAAPRLSRSA